jgi:hypothetical protein
VDEEEDLGKKKGKKGVKQPPKVGGNEKLSIVKGIQVRIQQNESLRKLEIRFISLNRHFLQALFRGLQKNACLQKLILTHEALAYATAGEYNALGEALKANTALLLLDVSRNAALDDSLEYHGEITDVLINTPSSKLKKLRITVNSIDVKAHYLELLD